MIKKQLQILFVLLVLIAASCGTTKNTAKQADPLKITVDQNQDFATVLESLPYVSDVQEIKGNDFFEKTYEIRVEQPLDHQHPEKGSFKQRVFVFHKGFDRPALLVTEGYQAGYAKNPRYINELSPMLGSNEIVVEHRYFAESRPENAGWEYLTVANAAGDHHRITEIFKNLYKGKWINTGISKGGQTTIYHRKHYPNDVDVSIPYVAPINFAVEDPREEEFLRNVATEECRERILDYQHMVLTVREALMPGFKKYCEEKNFTFNIPMDAVLDYCVLEYPFAFFQWGHDCDKIPQGDVVQELLDHLLEVSAPDYFAIEAKKPTEPFFYQAAHELGYYGYDTKPFEGKLSIPDAEGYLLQIFSPVGDSVEYIPESMIEVDEFIKNHGDRILYIYGEYDPWSASAAVPGDNTDHLKIVKKGGSHATRIRNLPEEQKQQVFEKLSEWLEMNVPVNE